MMINLFERFDQRSADLWHSQQTAGIELPTVVMNDDGFLPPEVASPQQTFGHFDQGRPGMYFDRLPVPRFWRIVGDQNAAGIYQESVKRANIEYLHRDNRRLVKAVQWLDSAGGFQWVDHYNQYGYRCAQTIYDHGQPVLKKYFTATGHQYAFQNLITGSLILDVDGQRYCFNCRNDFWHFYLARQRYRLDRVLYNTLNEPYQLSMSLTDRGADTLFWQEPLTGGLPANMQALMNKPTRTKHIIFQRYQDWQQYSPQLTSDQVDFAYLGLIYPTIRENQCRPRVLIVTNSDQVEQLPSILDALPDVHFDIMAMTAMSAKLLAVRRFANVALTPNASPAQIKAALANDDILLDINAGDEVLGVVRQAFEQNMLIMGFTATLHQPQYVTPENVFPKEEDQRLIHRVQVALADRSTMRKLVRQQRTTAGMVTAADYRRVFSHLADA